MNFKEKLLKVRNNSPDFNSAWVQHYLGTNKQVLGLKSKQIGEFAKEISVGIKDRSELVTIINSLYKNGTTFEELALAAAIFGRTKKYRPLDLKHLENWLSYTVGWAEVDSLCQSNFKADEVLKNWNTWQKFLIKLSSYKNIHHRRASLVLLCKTVGHSSDIRPFKLMIKLVEKLKLEKEILITKAISWVLRCAVATHPQELKKYLQNNQSTLPKIAYRETMKKLTTGRKN